MTQTERNVENHLRRRAEEAGGKCLKLSTLYESGLPDRLLILPVQIAFVETKRPRNGRLSPIQIKQMERLKKLGANVYVVWTYKDADTVIEDLTKKR